MRLGAGLFQCRGLGRTRTELSLQRILRSVEYYPPASLKAYQITHFTPFDPVSKRTEAEVKHDNTTFKVSKRALQVILDLVHPDADAGRRAQDQANH